MDSDSAVPVAPPVAFRAAAVDTHPGQAQVLRDYWTGRGHGGPTHHAFEEAIGWGTPGDFDRCVSMLTAKGHMTPEQAKGYCNLRHHEATGEWPAQHAEQVREGKASAPQQDVVAYSPSQLRVPAGYPTGGEFAPSGSGGGARPTPTNAAPVQQGQSGHMVASLQERLKALGYYHGQVDGQFGPQTLAAVKAFQAAHGLKVDGLVGPLTTAALRSKQAKTHHLKRRAPGARHHSGTRHRKPRKGKTRTYKTTHHHHGHTHKAGTPVHTHTKTKAVPASPSFAQLQSWLHQAQQGKQLSPAQMQALHKAHMAHLAHEKHLHAAAPQLVTIPGVDLVAAGTWELSSGRQTFTPQDFAHALDAARCPAVGDPVIKLGHVDPRFDGQPAIGKVVNMRPDASGVKLVGDLAGLPGWFADIAANAYPRRSIEGSYNFRCQIGHDHPFVVTGLAMLGVTAPGVGVLNTLGDVAALYGVKAAGNLPRSWHVDYEQGEPVMAVSEEDVRRAYYARAGLDPSWWIAELQMMPSQLVVAGADGKIYRVPFEIKADSISFGEPAELAGYAELAAARGTGQAVTYASAAESRAVAAAVDSSPWDAAKAWAAGSAASDPAKFFEAICLARKSDGDPKTQAGWALPYRYSPSSPPNAAALRAALAVLGGARGGVQGIDVAAAKSKAMSLLKQANPDYKAAEALAAVRDKRDELRAEFAAAAGGDADEDVRQMLAGLDATLDEASKLVPADTSDLPPDIGQALALIVAAEAIVDDLMDLMGVYDADDDDADEGHAAAAAGPKGGDAVPNKGGAANSEQPPDDGGGGAAPGGGPGPVHAPMGSSSEPVTHSHAHPAYGTQGGDQMHEHSHTHRGDANHAHAHASAGSNQKGDSEVDFTDEQLISLRGTLGLRDDEELDAARIVNATAALKASKVRASGAQLPPGVIAIEEEVWNGLQQKVEAAAAFQARVARNERDEVIGQAVRQGKFSASRTAHWQRLWDADPEGTREVLATLQRNTVPVDDIGGAGGLESDEDFDREFQALYPPGTFNRGR